MQIRIEKAVNGETVLCYLDEKDSTWKESVDGREIVGHTGPSYNLHSLLRGHTEYIYYNNHSKVFDGVCCPTVVNIINKIREIKTWVQECQLKDVQEPYGKTFTI